MESLACESKKRHNSLNNSGMSPLILSSLDPTLKVTDGSDKMTTNLSQQITDELHSLALDDSESSEGKSILLIDDNENLIIKSESAFLKALNLEPGKKVKVVSIFGNTGEGKSYTLNQIFFKGEEIFKTSSSQRSCTLGAWFKYDPNLNVICIDTEGLLGITKKENQRTRLLLKILAVSDIIIYRTRAERLQKDLYTFLGGASVIYKEHFSVALKKALSRIEGEKISSGLGPGVIIFHETRNTNTLHDLDDKSNNSQSAEEILRQNFAEIGLNCDSFSCLKYIGEKTYINSGTSFERLRLEIQKQLESSEVRSPRDAKYVYLMIASLNQKFQSQITDTDHQQYLAQFFTCPDKCQACKAGCSLSTGHKEDGEPHKCDSPCKYEHQYQNSVYLCKACIRRGERVVVKPSYQTQNDSTWTSYLSYVWSGYVIDCPKCGEIYRSRQHWIGNKKPEDSAVQLEIVHIWPGNKTYFQERPLFGYSNSAQRMVDGVSMITEAVTSVGSPPTKMLSDWVNDRIAPSYWRRNNDIKACFKCNVSFLSGGHNRIVPSKHHCRCCGEGFCDNCSSKACPVPQRGWYEATRVCDSCYEELNGRGSSLMSGVDENEVSKEVTARYISETFVNSISAVKSVLDVPKNFIKESAMPSYWTPNDECIECTLCKQAFSNVLPLHHCRDCGKGICDNCSKFRKPVPLRGWNSPVRVCDACR
ncbi:hypothetical protein ABEB36_013801 [Hypothenemus hampei]|uniref:FYVE-type domain-containing protein n=1 Tax=Hypothenemus hampei TaxID=57062 RepID=A0ABD1E5B6_HYPHA